MANVNPLLLVGAVIGVVTALLVFAYASVKDKKGSMGFERNMADGEIVRRLVQYAKPYGGKFIIVGFLVLFSISYDIASPLIVGYIEELVVGDFTLDHLFASVAVYSRPSSSRKWGSASFPTFAKTCLPTSSHWLTNSSMRSRWASWSPV